MMPHDLPPWQAVYAYFRKLQHSDLWQQINRQLVTQVREQAGRDSNPSTLIADSQSVKTVEKGVQKDLMAEKGLKGENGR